MQNIPKTSMFKGMMNSMMEIMIMIMTWKMLLESLFHDFQSLLLHIRELMFYISFGFVQTGN